MVPGEMSRKRGQASAAGQDLCQCDRAWCSLFSLKRYRMLSGGRSSEYFVFTVFFLFVFLSFSLTHTKFNCIYHTPAKKLHSSKSLWIILYCSRLFALSSANLLSPLKHSHLLSLEKFHHCSWGNKLSASFWNHKLLLSYHWRNFHTASLVFSIGINFWYGTLLISFTCILGTRKIISKLKSPGCSKIAKLSSNSGLNILCVSEEASPFHLTV